MPKRVRRLYSVERELVTKAREAALAAVQVFNNPIIHFKSELFIVTMNIAWTYLLHAYYRQKKIDYHYFEMAGTRKRYDKTKYGAKKTWVLETCLRKPECPLDTDTKNNLLFLLTIRHEIEHQMTTRIDDTLSAKFQACCINFNACLKNLFGEELAIDRYLAFSLQFASIDPEQVEQLKAADGLPSHVLSSISSFEESLTADQFNSQKFAYRVVLVPKTVNHVGQADKVIEFVRADSEIGKGVNAEIALIKETDKQKYLPGQIVDRMQAEGFTKFRMHEHTQYWRERNAKAASPPFGTVAAGKTWYWYENWVKEVKKHCEDSGGRYRE
jgi:hypothetical protein